MVEPARGTRRVLYWILAGLFFALAMIGVILPGIPTTPFLLLMCYFLVRVSPSMHAKAMAWPVVGGPLRDWRDQGGVRRNVKRLAYAMVTLLVGSTLVYGELSVSIKSVIACAAIYGIYVVARLPIAHANESLRPQPTRPS
ncbi:Inner membrane protein YbaN [Novipirellula galeiformis]|uniref:Inner membrane protein YbaN n=1 Tax=Novipirellula galeiformis TaxID=2528004 RepID=A0A5C6BZ95_9BACT|nr:YbaN family protein [Novipirellula galeiformis]TWU17265.1 Inner membrane protein YbaN [Novipirellula galeiformis]